MKNLSFIGFDRYAVTVDGKVYTLNDNKFMKLANDNGYIRVNLAKDGKKYRNAVHRLVALAFIPNPENKRTVNHIDGNKQNNHVSNLEWATHKEQTAHAIATGLKIIPEFTENRQVSDEDVHSICKYLIEGFRPIEVARLLDLPRHTIKNVRSGTQYKDVIKLYDFSKISKKYGRISLTKVERVCEMLVRGILDEEIIVSLDITKNVLDDIRERRTYQSVTSEYTF